MKKSLLIVFISIISASTAQNIGDQDMTFGTNGTTEYFISDTGVSSLFKGFEGSDMILLPNNSFLYTGTSEWGCSATSYYAKVLSRFTSDGIPDLTFNNQKSYIDNIGVSEQIIESNDGKYFIIGNASLKKIDSNGVVDLNFGTNGYVTTPNHSIKDMKQTSDGSIIVVANIYDISKNFYPGIFKFDQDGLPDLTFGTNGSVLFPNKKNWIYYTIDEDNEGNYLITGGSPLSVNDNSSTREGDLFVYKINSFGVPVTSFGQNGLFYTGYKKRYFPYYNTIFTRKVTDGIIVAAEGNKIYTYGNWSLLMFKIKGNDFDPTFANGLKSIPNLSIKLNNLLFKNDKLYVFGQSNGATYSAAKFNLNGELDTSYNGKGYVSFPGYGNDNYYAASPIIQGNKIILGQSFEYWICARSNSKIALRRFYFEGPNLGIDTENYSDLKIYPNPTSDYLMINSTLTNKEISVYSVEGKKLNLNPVIKGDKTIVNVKKLPKGTYYLTIKLNNKRINKTFIKN